MNTPICDFVRRYAESNALRLHMPGHKGADSLGFETLDITEIEGADSLYEAKGIIAESEKNAGKLFGCNTYYSAEGSSLAIRAMLYLAAVYARQSGKRPHVFAGRNAHKTFVSAAAMIGFDVSWIYPSSSESYLTCGIEPHIVEHYIADSRCQITALYLTTPDYLGNMTALEEIARICHKHRVLLLVDNAHGAYLKFLPRSLHPMDLGADICTDSAHKTLPVLTGGAYLHISKNAPELILSQAKNALAMFGSTSPSYLILQSLDAANKYIFEGYRDRLAKFALAVCDLKEKLTAHGYAFCGEEPLKLTILAKKYGYLGDELAAALREKNIVCEFSDPDFVVLMVTPETGETGLARLEEALLSVPKKKEITLSPPLFCKCERVMNIREAAFCECEIVPTENCEGRILAATTVGCPPAVPIIVCGERVDKNAIERFKYYGIDNLTVIKR